MCSGEMDPDLGDACAERLRRSCQICGHDTQILLGHHESRRDGDTTDKDAVAFEFCSRKAVCCGETVVRHKRKENLRLGRIGRCVVQIVRFLSFCADVILLLIDFW